MSNRKCVPNDKQEITSFHRSHTLELAAAVWQVGRNNLEPNWFGAGSTWYQNVHLSYGILVCKCKNVMTTLQKEEENPQKRFLHWDCRVPNDKQEITSFHRSHTLELAAAVWQVWNTLHIGKTSWKEWMKAIVIVPFL
jgi:hypothetical protein